MDSFDPYYNWLGIPPHDQPPNHYRLLGLELFESNPNVIESASDRQMAHLRSFSTGPRAALAQFVLNQVSAAKICLLDPARKAQYDAKLDASLLPAPMAQPPVAPAPGISAPPPPAPFSPFSAFYSQPSTQQTRSSKNSSLESVKVMVGGLAGIALGGLILYIFFPQVLGLDQRPARATTRNNKPARATTDVNSRIAKSPSNPHTPAGSSSSSAAPRVGNPSRTKPQRSTVNRPARSPQKGTTGVSDGSRFSTDPSSENELELVPNMPVAASKPRSEASGEKQAKPAARSSDALPASIDLPNVANRSWQTLFPATGASFDTLQLVPTLVSGSSDLSLVLSPLKEENSTVWSIRFELRPAAGVEPVSGELARLDRSTDGANLRFMWTHDNPVATAALRNSWLTMEVKGERKWVALRAPSHVDPPKLDFANDRQLVALTIDACPPADQLELHIPSMTELSLTAKFRKDMNSAKVDRQIIVEFAEVPGAEIRLQLKQTSATQLAVLIQSRLKESPTKEVDLSLPQSEKLRKTADRASEELEERTKILQGIVTQAQADVTLGQQQVQSLSGTAAQRANVLINARIAEMREAERQLALLKQDSEKIDARLDAIDGLDELLKSLQGKPIPFQVLVKGTSRELILVEALGDRAEPKSRQPR